MNKKLTYAGIAAMLLLVISGCGDKPTAAPADASGQDSTSVSSGAEGNNAGNDSPTATPAATSTPEPTPEATVTPAAPAATEAPAVSEKQSLKIKTYYTDLQQNDLIPAEVTITFKDAKQKYTEAFKSLQRSENADQIPLWNKIELKSLEFSGGQIVMDIHKPDEAQLGAGGEALAIGALSQMFFQFDEVKNIDVLVDGEQVESLMGHVDLVHPITRENNGL
ncbi:GerMN domain-containing protein [Paenibacillus sp. FSL K6-1217]|uniref:GerMN domain-containing protein n=1 Tax=Paenibacillus sp. FSL K6-1217 TaxID=2921466 RepID=UPI00324B72A7